MDSIGLGKIKRECGWRKSRRIIDSYIRGEVGKELFC
jgi:hypothetical protein